MRRIAKVLALGAGGLLLSFALTFAAYGLAGKDLSQPAKLLNVGGDLAPSSAASPGPDERRTSPTPTPKPHHTPPPKQHVTPPPTNTVPPPPPPPPSGTHTGSGGGEHQPHDD